MESFHARGTLSTVLVLTCDSSVRTLLLRVHYAILFKHLIAICTHMIPERHTQYI
jgi:hypothetical protein